MSKLNRFLDFLYGENNKRIKYIPLILLSLLITYSAFRQYEIQKYKAKVIGVVTKISFTGNFRYSLDYEYTVNDVKYIGSVGVSNFICDDGTKGCVGKKFEIYYSTKNPEYSRIYLGKYEKNKQTVEFFK
ncbi:hypothetical protein QVZ41_14275 [Wenyingzhuangia sp. chi5]|uniref:DUF3139 domain-containing protein n=1 Tax=Wenyingzhuangia gilva TaxID=3057677 RepID=A0ABT8VVM5_9FLAO|nr:hypothetical protein [Wenyingzhuangia sp. chi5]MDO3696015.1 hypothetical protein [Wenyingzhuangia sp. chi5]